MRPIPRPKHPLDSFKYAVEGIVHVFRTQKHMRFHFLTLALVLLLGMLYRLSRAEMALLLVVAGNVLVAEMINTALESVVDMVTQAYHPLAKLAKDIAAGAVLITAMIALVVGAVVFLGNNKLPRMRSVVDQDPLPVTVIIGVSILVLIVVTISKIYGGKGSILSGGIVSGHAAVAFCLAATVMYRTMDFFSAALAIALAALVAQSRVEGKIHTLQEVILGGLLGTALTSTIYLVRFPLR